MSDRYNFWRGLRSEIKKLNDKNEFLSDCDKVKNFIKSPMFKAQFITDFTKKTLISGKDSAKFKTYIRLFSTSAIGSDCIDSIKNSDSIKNIIGNSPKIEIKKDTISIETEGFVNTVKDFYPSNNECITECQKVKRLILSPLFDIHIASEISKSIMYSFKPLNTIIDVYADNSIIEIPIDSSNIDNKCIRLLNLDDTISSSLRRYGYSFNIYKENGKLYVTIFGNIIT